MVRFRLGCRYGGLFAGLISFGLVLTACDVSSMEFIRDERIRIVQPRDRSIVTLPVSLRWEIRDFAVTGKDRQGSSEGGYFAVFVDRPPIPPKATLEWYVQQNESCGDSPCGSIENLADVYTTEETSLELHRLRAVRERGGVERHEVVIVLMDGAGARMGESAFHVRFGFEREA